MAIRIVAASLLKSVRSSEGKARVHNTLAHIGSRIYVGIYLPIYIYIYIYMVTHPTRTPPKGIFHIFVSIICFTSLSGSNGDSFGRGPMEKTKKNKKNSRKNKNKKNKKTIFGNSLGGGPMEKIKKKNKYLEKTKKTTQNKKTIFGDSLGERPHGENPKNLKKPRENKKNTIFGDSWLDPPIHQDLWKIVFFFLFSRGFFDFPTFWFPRPLENCIIRFHGICPYLPVYVTSWSFAAFSLLYLIYRRAWPSQLLLLRQLLSFRQPSDNHASHTLLHPSIHCEFYSS